LRGGSEYSGGQAVTEADKKKQAATLADLAKLPEGTTIEEWTRQCLMANIIIPDKQKKLH
jgi:hypothetical protein